MADRILTYKATVKAHVILEKEVEFTVTVRDGAEEPSQDDAEWMAKDEAELFDLTSWEVAYNKKKDWEVAGLDYSEDEIE
jgi:hypothetical protein